MHLLFKKVVKMVAIMSLALIVKPLSALEKLDYVLVNTGHQRNYADVINDLCNDAVLNIDEHNLKLILNKLVEDMYIDFIYGHRFVMGEEAHDGMQIRRNFNGDLLLEQGGYVGEANVKRRKEEISELAIARTERNERLLMRWTAAVAVGAIGLVLWEAYKYFFGHSE